MIFPVGQTGKLRPEAARRPAAEPPASAGALTGPRPAPRRPMRAALPRSPFPGPDPRLCLTDDLSCRQSIGSSSRGERRTKRALWPGGPLTPRVLRRDPLRNSERRPPSDSRVMSSRPRGPFQSPRAAHPSPGGLPGAAQGAPPLLGPPGNQIGGHPQREALLVAPVPAEAA